MRLDFPAGPLTLHRNVFFVCASSAALLGSAYQVYAELLAQLERDGCPKPAGFADAKMWLQALLVGTCLFMSAALYSFFALWQC